MNADNLVDALREAEPALWIMAASGNKDAVRIHKKILAALSAHDAQPAQAAQPVGVPDGTTPFWVIERHNNSVLEYWSIGYLGSGDVHQWSCNINDATKFWNPASAGFVLSRLLSGIGNVVQHGYIAVPQPPAQPSADAEITDDMVREWMERNDLACVTFGDARTAIEDARSLEYAARAAEGDV